MVIKTAETKRTPMYQQGDEIWNKRWQGVVQVEEGISKKMEAAGRTMMRRMQDAI